MIFYLLLKVKLLRYTWADLGPTERGQLSSRCEEHSYQEAIGCFRLQSTENRKVGLENNVLPKPAYDVTQYFVTVSSSELPKTSLV